MTTFPVPLGHLHHHRQELVADELTRFRTPSLGGDQLGAVDTFGLECS